MLISLPAQDMHYADFAEDEVSSFVRLPATSHTYSVLLTYMQSANLLQAIKEYEQNKWKTIGLKVGKPAKVSRVLPPRFVILSELLGAVALGQPLKDAVVLHEYVA